MRGKLLGLGTAGVLLVVVFLVLATVGAVFWVLTDGKPLVYQDATPATVPETGQQESGFHHRNTTDFDVAPLPWPVVRNEFQVRVFLSVYATGLDPSNPGVGPGNTTDEVPDVRTLEAENVSVAAVLTMSAMELGPVALNPAVYASDPGLLGQSGLVVDELEERADLTVSDVEIRNTGRVTMLGSETELTVFRAVVTPDGGGVPVRATIRLARVVHDGDLVLVVTVTPDGAEDGETFETFLSRLEHGDEPDATGRIAAVPVPHDTGRIAAVPGHPDDASRIVPVTAHPDAYNRDSSTKMTTVEPEVPSVGARMS